MPKVSINILTQNRAEYLKKALASVESQNFFGYEVVVVNDGSADNTAKVLDYLKQDNFNIISHNQPMGITASRQEALEASKGEYIAVLDDDDEWTDADKLKKQADFLDKNPDYVLVGGAIQIPNTQYPISKIRPKSDEEIRKTMLLRNNFFTSTVMMRKSSAIAAGGFLKDANDFSEDYDLWLRMGNFGKMYNFQGAFANYRLPNYNKAKYKAFLNKQLRLIYREKSNYPRFWLAYIFLKLRFFL